MGCRPRETIKKDQAVAGVPTSGGADPGPVLGGIADQDTGYKSLGHDGMDLADSFVSAPKVAQIPDPDPAHEIMKFDWVPDAVAKYGGFLPCVIWPLTRLFRRLSAAIAWHKPHKSVYTLSSVVPAAASFGSYKNKFLNYKGKLLTVAFVARLMGGSFREGEGEPARCGSVTFKFVREIDDLVCRSLLYGKARPPEGAYQCYYLLCCRSC